MLEQIFLKVIDMSREAGIVIAVVLLVRMFLKKFPKLLSYLLWSVVLFRLLCPVTLESKISLVPNLNTLFYEDAFREDILQEAAFLGNTLQENTAVLQESGKPAGLDSGINRGTQGIEQSTGHNTGQNAGQDTGEYTEQDTGQGKLSMYTQANAQEYSPDKTPDKTQERTSGNPGILQSSWQKWVILYGKYLWTAGMGLMLLYFLISVVKIHRKVSVSIPFKENIYIADGAASPFVMGIWNPKIYLPAGLKEKEQEYIILHEKFHIRRLDHVVKPAAFIALSIHWFNPLVWLAFILFSRDMEMSCDEAVINRLGETVRADYAASLLALSTKGRVVSGIPVDFGEGDTKERIKNLAAFKKTKKAVLAVLIAGVGALIICLAFTQKTVVLEEGETWTEAADNDRGFEELESSASEGPAPEKPEVSINLAEHYITRTGDPSNFYKIDENKMLWGSGRNEYGQLGQGAEDTAAYNDKFYSEEVKIAENVIHVDYSQKGFMIFLTEDGKLYGMGNAGSGALQQYEAFDWNRYLNGEDCRVATPALLMEDVTYACCGRDDIVCLKEDGTVWTWGTVYAEGGFLSDNVYFIEKPTKILENAVLVTGGWFHHGALLRDGTVWTWGYNSAGNCGVESPAVIKEPVLVVENASMVWTNLTAEGPRQNTEYQGPAEFNGVYPRFLNNTLIQKADGSYWICGENVGSEEKVVHGAEGDYSIVCSHEFYPCEGVGKPEIDYGIEVRTDIDGDGKAERVSVRDCVTGENAFTQISARFENGETVFKDYPDYWSSYLVTGDLTGDGASDVVLMRVSTGSTYGGGEFSVLHMGERGWEEYSHAFISNSEVAGEQPENFEEVACVGASIVSENDKCLLRIIELEDPMKDTVRCIDCSYREDGWLIEEIRLITDYYGKNKEQELLNFL